MTSCRKGGDEEAQTGFAGRKRPRGAGTKGPSEHPASKAGRPGKLPFDRGTKETSTPLHTNRMETKIDVDETSIINRAGQSLPASAVKENDDRMLLQEKLRSCQLQLNDKALQITRLEGKVSEGDHLILELRNKVTKIQQQLCEELEGCGSYSDGAATPFIFETSLKAVQTAAASFTKACSEYAKLHMQDVNCALKKHFRDAYLTRPSHVMYYLRAWTLETLFQDFENEMFFCGGTSIFLDETERRLKSFEYFQLLEASTSALDKRAEYWFDEFRRQKLQAFLSLWQSSDQTTVPRLSIHALENPGAEMATVRLLETFRAVAKRVWSLHKLSYSFESRAEIFRVSPETELHAEYMDSVVSVQDDERFVEKVGFVICPGFRLGRSVFKCDIYLAAGGI